MSGYPVHSRVNPAMTKRWKRLHLSRILKIRRVRSANPPTFFLAFELVDSPRETPGTCTRVAGWSVQPKGPVRWRWPGVSLRCVRPRVECSQGSPAPGMAPSREDDGGHGAGDGPPPAHSPRSLWWWSRVRCTRRMTTRTAVCNLAVPSHDAHTEGSTERREESWKQRLSKLKDNCA